MASERSGESRSSDDGREVGEDTGTDPDNDPTTTTTPDNDTTTPDDARDDPVSVDELFELLSRPGNRYILAYVIRSDGPVPYADLVEYVVDKGGTPPGFTTTEFRNRVAARLVHSNLPKLDDAGLVTFDTTDKTIEATAATEVVVPYLELATEQSLHR